MPTFQYVAVDGSGRRIAGKMVEPDRDTVLSRIRELGQYPAEVHQVLVEEPEEGQRGGGFRLGGIRRADLTLFSRQLANLVRGGLPLLRAFTALIDHTENPKLRDVLVEVRQSLHEGNSLHEALAQHSEVFPDLYVSMVRAGEASGELQGVLEWLAELMETEQAQRSQVWSAMAYPLFVLSVGALAVSALLIFMVPKFVEIFSELGHDMPPLTAAVIGLSNLLAHWWWLLGLGTFFLFALFRLWSATVAGRLVWHRFKLAVPVFGRLTSKVMIARFCRTLSTLLRGGVPILEALTVVRDVIGNEVMARAVDTVRDRVREGSSMTEPLGEFKLFPSLLTHMVGVGEETGDMPGVLDTVANAYDVEIESAMRAVIALIEPLVIGSLGLVIAIIILAMLMPVFQMNLLVG